MLASEKRQIVLDLAAGQGFELCGIASAAALERAGYYREWLAAGHAANMRYLHDHVDLRTSAGALLPGARSVIVCGLNYHQPATPLPPGDGQRGRVAMYAWGDDYHRVIKDKLFALADALHQRIGEPFETKVCVDTAPLVEREYAARAGIGWLAKNTMVLNQHLGSYFFLGEIVTTLELPPDSPAIDHCGTCRRCLDACPTGAFPAPYRMDASRCISYLTIECRDPELPAELQAAMGDWVFGCDVCQQVCPYNREPPTTREPRFAIRAPGPAPRLVDLLTWSDEAYRDVLRGSALKRAKPEMLRRNAQVAQRNGATGDADSIGPGSG